MEKVAALHVRLGQDDQAEDAIARAIDLFEGLAARSPEDAEIRYKLAQTCSLADPETAPASALGRVEERLGRARTLLEQLASGSPDSIEYAQARVKVAYKLGAVSRRKGLLDRAEASFREAVQLAGSLGARWPGDIRPPLDRAVTREALAQFLIDRGRAEEAKQVLDAIVLDLRAVPTFPGPGGPVPDRLRAVARMYATLGETGRAEEITRSVDERKEPSPFDDPPPPGRPGAEPGGEQPGRHEPPPERP